MAVNRYDEAAPVEYVSQYVPIPFQELFTMAKYYGDEIKTARKELNEYAKSVGEFQSLLTKDVDSYHRIALNDNIRRIMDEAVANPNVMKSAAWRSGMAGALNNVDYASLSKLKKSAEQADLYDKLYKQLAAQGKMPPGWEKDWYSTYDTLAEQKIFDKTPLAYQSVDDLAWEYVKDLPDTFLGKGGGYNWFGVNEETALKQIGDNSHELFAHPVIQRHIEMLKSIGMDEKTAMDNVMNRAKLTALRKVHKTPKEDPYAVADYSFRQKLALEQAKAGLERNGNTIGYEDILGKQYSNKIQQVFQKQLLKNPDFSTRLNESANDNYTALRNTISTVIEKSPQFGEIYNQLLESIPNFDKLPENVKSQQIIAITEALLNDQKTNSLLSQEDVQSLSSALGEIQMSNIEAQNTAMGLEVLDGFRETFKMKEGNPFEKVKVDMYGDNKYTSNYASKMWENGLNKISEKAKAGSLKTAAQMLFDESTEIEYGENTKRKGYDAAAYNLMSPKQYLIQNFQTLGEYASDAGYDIESSRLNPNNNGVLDIEEDLAMGKLSGAVIKNIVGYVDTTSLDGGKVRDYVVNVSVPLSELKDRYENWYEWIDDVEDALKEYDFKFEGTGDDTRVVFEMVMPSTNNSIDMATSNRMYENDYGTTKSHDAKINSDNYYMNNLRSITPGTYWEE